MVGIKKRNTIQINAMDDKRYIHSVAEYKTKNLLEKMDSTQKKLSIFCFNTHDLYSKFVYEIRNVDSNDFITRGNVKIKIPLQVGVIAKYNVNLDEHSI